ncbi:MAG TPA: hypothetical protein VLA00_16415 [Xanthobacteraceae bacterium]|nr:hypothetical protein [Xanthobacteraceae bacterium]
MARKRRIREAWDAAPAQPFVSISKSLLQEPAWRALPFGARCLYVGLKSFFNGQNNGSIYLGVRKAAAELDASRSSTERWFKDLQEHGFIRPTQKAFLGSEGKASATYWRLTEIGHMGEQPTRDFKNWTPPENRIPHLKSGQTVPKIGTPRHDNRDMCHENRDGFASKPAA